MSQSPRWLKLQDSAATQELRKQRRLDGGLSREGKHTLIFERWKKNQEGLFLQSFCPILYHHHTKLMTAGATLLILLMNEEQLINTCGNSRLVAILDPEKR